MKSNNWTTYRLAKQMNLEQNRIEKVVNGKVKDPRISTVVKIAKALNLTDDEFIELCGYKSHKQD
nr:helix-turn-helix transcriptional regulator [Erysipelatoclostridium sp. An15]